MMMEERSSTIRAAVQLKRRKLVDGYVDALTPENITNSGKFDGGGWIPKELSQLVSAKCYQRRRIPLTPSSVIMRMIALALPL
mmetsp:Transcript_1923/g.3239  ORF Transcript_1923/g.3239 Transcript_1923/m.3239 type:complete len:83 (-) Transcript_1923:192-440(-)|eukprot:scaffold12619_cov133-Skeletonema_menzelii.AAC.9